MGSLDRDGDPEPALSEPSADLNTLLLQGEDMIEQLGAAHARAWGLGTAGRWDLDQRTGLITWTFPDKTATAPAQILGSFNAASESWLWAWANDSILPEMSRDARAVRDWGQVHGHRALTEPKVHGDASTAGALVALAVRITRATGYYKGGDSGAIPIITFGPVTLTSKDGGTRTVTVEIG
jgi:hypothetical protein